MLLVTDQAIRADRKFDRLIHVHLSEFEQAGRFHSAYNVKGSFDILRDVIDEFSKTCFELVRRSSKIYRNFLIVATKTQELKRNLIKDLEQVHRAAHRLKPAKYEEITFDELRQELDDDVARNLRLATFQFDEKPLPSGEGEIHAVQILDLASNRAAVSRKALEQWWQELGTDREAMAQTLLYAQARSAFPDKHVARSRIRALAGPRKRGRKVIGQKDVAD